MQKSGCSLCKSENLLYKNIPSEKNLFLPATCGKKAGNQIIPCCHSSAFMVASIHFEMVGSKKARLTLATTSAPAQQAMCGSMRSLQIGVPSGLTFPSSCSLAFIRKMFCLKMLNFYTSL